jgi:DNA-binding transcriptional regulator LsrR (DeoR family)
MNNSSVDVNENNEEILRSRNRVLDLDSKGYTQQEIADTIGISQPTVSRYLKEARESAVNSRTEYVRHAFHDLERTRMGQDRALKGLWSIAEDPAASFSDKLRAYSLIVQCNTRKSQSNTIARALSQWLDSEEKVQRDREYESLTDEQKLQRAFEGESQHQSKASDSDPSGDISAFMRDI